MQQYSFDETYDVFDDGNYRIRYCGVKVKDGIVKILFSAENRTNTVADIWTTHMDVDFETYHDGCDYYGGVLPEDTHLFALSFGDWDTDVFYDIQFTFDISHQDGTTIVETDSLRLHIDFNDRQVAFLDADDENDAQDIDSLDWNALFPSDEDEAADEDNPPRDRPNFTMDDFFTDDEDEEEGGGSAADADLDALIRDILADDADKLDEMSAANNTPAHALPVFSDLMLSFQQALTEAEETGPNDDFEDIACDIIDTDDCHIEFDNVTFEGGVPTLEFWAHNYTDKPVIFFAHSLMTDDTYAEEEFTAIGQMPAEESGLLYLPLEGLEPTGAHNLFMHIEVDDTDCNAICESPLFSILIDFDNKINVASLIK